LNVNIDSEIRTSDNAGEGCQSKENRIAEEMLILINAFSTPLVRKQCSWIICFAIKALDLKSMYFNYIHETRK
jgi:hypothetical protein